MRREPARKMDWACALCEICPRPRGRTQRLARRSLQAFQRRDHFAVGPVSFVGLRFNRLENRTQRVEQVQQTRNDGRIRRQLAIAQQTQQVLTRMGQLFQPLETEKTRRAFDRVHRAKDLGDQRSILRTLLQIRQAALHAVQPFLALNQEFSRQFIHCIFRLRTW